MSGSIASVATQQAAANASSNQSSQSSSQNALSQLSGNFSDFLNMLMTQPQNQDPTSPLETNQFTSELVEFSGVEQQINTNNSLTQLIQLTQAGEVMQGSSMAGKQVSVTSTQIPLQNGSGSVSFTAPSAETVAITITNSSGQAVRSALVSATQGQNTWNWNGESDNGSSLPDGAYGISVNAMNSDGSTTPLTFSVTGTVTGVTSGSSNGVQLELGSVTVPFTSITSMQQ
jgi:flagellar basal-body rod modification protein FlgD